MIAAHNVLFVIDSCCSLPIDSWLTLWQRFGMFERTLQDLIRGLRAHKASSKAQEDAFIQDAMVEIREELKGKDMALKAEGMIKMCYVRTTTCRGQY